MVDDRRSTPERDEACAVALFEARGKAGRIEDAIYERICELFGEDVIEDTSHDEYDMSIELYTKHDIVPTVDQITAITAMGFSCGWINFPDETQISFNRGQISKRHKRTYDKYPKNPRRIALSERTGWKRGDRRVVCAALRDQAGRIVTGARHFDAVMMEQLKRDLDGMSWRAAEQGFIDQFGKFLTREEARVIAEEQGQILDPNGGGPVSLYSENLY